MFKDIAADMNNMGSPAKIYMPVFYAHKRRVQDETSKLQRCMYRYNSCVKSLFKSFQVTNDSLIRDLRSNSAVHHYKACFHDTHRLKSVTLGKTCSADGDSGRMGAHATMLSPFYNTRVL